MHSLKPDVAVPLYQQLYDTLHAQIRDGVFVPGAQIPSEERLSELYSISRVTVRHALERLCDEGVLVKRHGKGTFVAMPVFVESMAGGSFTMSCRQRGAVPTTRILWRNLQLASAPVAQSLSLQPGDEVICIGRVRLVDEVATILEVDYFRGDCIYIMDADLTETPLSELIWANTGLRPCCFEDIFDITRATRSQAGYLLCTQGTPLLRVWQTAMAEQRQVLYCNEQLILTEHYKYVVCYRGD